MCVCSAVSEGGVCVKGETDTRFVCVFVCVCVCGAQTRAVCLCVSCRGKESVYASTLFMKEERTVCVRAYVCVRVYTCSLKKYICVCVCVQCVWVV